MTGDQCPICLNRCEFTWLRDGGSMSAIVKCRQCGRFECSDAFIEDVTGGDRVRVTDLLPALSAYTRQASERGERGQLRTEDWEDLARLHVSTPVAQKLLMLLAVAGGRSAHPGAVFRIDPHDFPLVDAASELELKFYVDHLVDSGSFASAGAAVGPSGLSSYRLTTKALAQLEAGSAGVPGRCFVAMWFDSGLEDAWLSGIFPALKTDCGLHPVRLDLVHHNEKICDRILAEIRQAQFMVADFTGHRGGVYFEAGFALGLGRPVIWTCREDDLGSAHFDTRQYNHIVWSQPADLRVKLRDRVKATILR